MTVRLLVHGANVLFLGAYLIRDILWLRSLTIIGGLALFPYYVWGNPTPLYEPIAWNTVFILINAIQIFRLLRERLYVLYNLQFV